MNKIVTEDTKTKMVRLTFTLSGMHVKKVKQISKKMGITVSDFLRRAIDEAWGRLEVKKA